MALGADHAEPARGEHLLLGLGHLGLDIGDGGIALGALGQILQLVLDAELDIAAQLNIGAAPGHIGGDGHRTKPTGLRHDMCLHLVEAGIQHGVLHPLAGEIFAE